MLMMMLMLSAMVDFRTCRCRFARSWQQTLHNGSKWQLAQRFDQQTIYFQIILARNLDLSAVPAESRYPNNSQQICAADIAALTVSFELSNIHLCTE
jgi:hypothetical protein